MTRFSTSVVLCVALLICVTVFIQHEDRSSDMLTSSSRTIDWASADQPTTVKPIEPIDPAKLRGKTQKAGLGYTALLRPDEDWAKTLGEIAQRNEPGGPAAIVTIEGVVLPGRPGIEGRVYLNKPDADLKTGKTDDHYVGSFSIGAVEQGGTPQNYLLNLTPALRKLAKTSQFNPAEPLKVTVVGVNRRGGAEAPPVLEFEAATLTIEK